MYLKAAEILSGLTQRLALDMSEWVEFKKRSMNDLADVGLRGPAHMLLEDDRTHGDRIRASGMLSTTTHRSEMNSENYVVVTTNTGMQDMRSRRLYVPEGMVDDGDAVQFLPSIDGNRNVYRPIDRESHMRHGIPHEPGQLAIRGEADHRLVQLFGMPRTPPAAISDGPYGLGLVQDFVSSTELRPIHEYKEKQQQQMAFLDYLMGYTDGNPNNYRTALGGKYFQQGDLVGVDRDLILPEEPDPRWGIRSPFVAKYKGQPFDSDILDLADAVHPDRIPATLDSFGPSLPQLSDRAIEGAQARLVEMQTDRMITGRAWESLGGRFTSDPI